MIETAQVDYHAASQALVDGCVDLRSDEERVALLQAVCSGLGDELYPAFVQVLWLVSCHGDHGAREIVARTLIHALRTGRLPSGRHAAWGRMRSGGVLARPLGPIEYLCAWYAQEWAVGDPRALDAEQFQAGANALMNLVGASRGARQLYCEKLLADVADPIGGTFSRSTREALRALADAWREGAAAADASARFVAVVDRSRGTSLGALAGAPMRTRSRG